MQEQNSTETTLRDFYDVLFRHKRRSLLFFCCVMIAVTLVTFLLPEIFRSEATLMIRLGRESVSLDPTATTGQVVSIGMDKENEINSELAILQSRELAEKVVDAIGVEMILNGPEKVPGPEDSVLSKVRYGIHRMMQASGRFLAEIAAFRPGARSCRSRAGPGQGGSLSHEEPDCRNCQKEQYPFPVLRCKKSGNGARCTEPDSSTCIWISTSTLTGPPAPTGFSISRKKKPTGRLELLKKSSKT